MTDAKPLRPRWQKTLRRKRRANAWYAVALLMLLGGCVPTRSAIKAPYEIDGRTYGEPEIQVLARDRCAATHSRAGMPPFAFTTDGCSLWPDGAWLECCLKHDLVYWCGGTREARRTADRELRACVRRVSSAANSELMYLGVRFGGHPLWPFPWRWGYGFPWSFDMCVYGGGDVCPPRAEPEPPVQ